MFKKLFIKLLTFFCFGKMFCEDDGSPCLLCIKRTKCFDACIGRGYYSYETGNINVRNGWLYRFKRRLLEDYKVGL
jgi:hypothetical protein